MPELVLKLGDSVLQNYVFDKDIMSVGRSRDNDVVIENLSVSRNHARIRRQGGKYILTDLNSANGTFVNGVRVSKTEIVDQDVIAIGKHKMHFQNKVVAEEALIVDAFGADRTVMVERALPSGMIVVTDGKLKGQQFALTKGETSVGKASNNDVVLSDDWFLGKRQAVIMKRGEDHYELNDLGSFRKTKVNGEPITGPTRLKAGDIVEFGNTRCVFQFTGDNYAEQAGGRVPQELGLEDSIFSTGASDLQVVEYVQTPPPSNGQQPHFEMEPEQPVYGGFSEGGDAEETPTPFAPAAVSASNPMDMDSIDLGTPNSIEIEDLESAPHNEPEVAEAPAEIEPEADSDHEPEVAHVGAGSSNRGNKKKKKKRGSSNGAGAEMEPGFTTERFSAAPSSQQLEPSQAPDSARLPSDVPGWHDGFDSDKIVSIPLLEEARIQREDEERQSASAAAKTEPLADYRSDPDGSATDESSAAPASDAPAVADDQRFQSTGESKATEVLLDPDQLASEIALWEAALTNKSAVIRKQAAKNLKKLTGKDYAY